MTTDHWKAAARAELLELRGNDHVWGYRKGAAAAAEPTALAALALLASGDDSAPSRIAAEWLAKMQRSDGSVGIGEGTLSGWMTPHAMQVWAAFPDYTASLHRGSRWLLGLKGLTLNPKEDPAQIAGHDTMLVGWPWVAETHSWLEPTAMAILALSRDGFAKHDRVIEGLAVIRNREIAYGGWNYGNKAVFGKALRPQPAPTGLALLALAGVDTQTRAISRAIDYLTKALPGVRACASLGWGLIGLQAWGVRPEASESWLLEAYTRVQGKPDAAPKLACLLLAASDRTLSLFGKFSRMSPSNREGEAPAEPFREGGSAGASPSRKETNATARSVITRSSSETPR